MKPNGFGKQQTVRGNFETPHLETGLHRPPHPAGSGAAYRAANWIPLGQTQGRGRMDRYHQADGSARKLLLVYPLCRDVQQRFREAQPPCFSEAEAAVT